MSSVRDLLAVAVTALAMAVLVSAANAAYAVHLLSHPTERDLLLDIAPQPLVWLAILNKPMVLVAFHISRDPTLSEWTRVIRILGGLLGVAGGSIAGVYLLLWTFGRVLTRQGSAFGWKALGIFKWTCVVVCSAYAIMSLWHIFKFRDSFELTIQGKIVGNAIGLFAFTISLYVVFAFGGRYAYLANKAWFDAKRKW